MLKEMSQLGFDCTTVGASSWQKGGLRCLGAALVGPALLGDQALPFPGPEPLLCLLTHKWFGLGWLPRSGTSHTPHRPYAPTAAWILPKIGCAPGSIYGCHPAMTHLCLAPTLRSRTGLTGPGASALSGCLSGSPVSELLLMWTEIRRSGAPGHISSPRESQGLVPQCWRLW